MMQKMYTLENLDCAGCAAKIEAKLNAVPEVEEAVIIFATRQLRLTAENPDALIEHLTAIARTVESEVTILPAASHHHEHHHEGCSCSHDHDAHDHCDCHDHRDCHHEHHHHSEDTDFKSILLGAALFAGGLILHGCGMEMISLFIFACAYMVLGREIISKAWSNLRSGHMLDENFLMSIASIGAFFIGEFAEAVGVILFYRIGEYFEERAVARSRSQIMEAVDMRPETVILENGHTIPAADAKVGDILIVRPGDRIPLDGIVVSGESRIDTAPITGEPVPIRVHSGETVISGCVNLSGQLRIRAEHPLSESMVSRILHSVENATASKPKIDRFITRFARVYTPIVVASAAAVAIIPSLFTGNWSYWIYTALSFLVMSCPCALVLSVPLAFFSGIGAGSKRGILFKGGASIEALSRVQAVAMDKTGTLTRGDFCVQSINGGDRVLQLAASCEQYSTHPIGISILQAAKERGIPLDHPEKVEEIAGQGIRAVYGGSQILCGSEKLMAAHGICPPEQSSGAGTRVIIAVNGCCEGDLLIADTLKSEAPQAVRRLTQLGLATAMLTGDNEKTAAAIAKETGVAQVYARLLPDEKLYDIFTDCAKKGVGIELNMKTLSMSDADRKIMFRPYFIAKDCGCKFYLGSDSHSVKALETVKENFEDVITSLDLKETDKFPFAISE